jgi:hypothetical protein
MISRSRTPRRSSPADYLGTILILILIYLE